MPAVEEHPRVTERTLWGRRPPARLGRYNCHPFNGVFMLTADVRGFGIHAFYYYFIPYSIGLVLSKV